MNLNENADIRRAIDRLQQVVEVLSDRHREMRRERKQLRERIDELTQEREIAVAAASSQMDAAAAERTRAIKLEERARAAEASASELEARVVELERLLADRDAQLAELERGSEDLAVLRASVVAGQRERALLEEKHLQAIAKLDAATRAEAMARTEAAAAANASQALEERCDALLGEKAALEAELANRGAGDAGGAAHAEELEARERDLRAAHETLTRREQEHAAAVASLQHSLAAADTERESLGRRIAELEEHGRAAQSIADGLREQLASAGDTDDERIKALHARVGELAGELAESRKLASQRDETAADALREAETLRSRIAGMEDEIRHLKAAGGGMPSLFEEGERRLLAEQIDNAINLIDQHLASST
ncbi:MAG TPA: hypothetical protein VHI13_02415 [Candidatus Kapabacteria bacterium]|nr:hypothetical protein [Candidatus Kapabacteria bacterium]